jgi:hypothetical protein
LEESRYDEIPRRTLICNDGLALSVQASSQHYCTPKVDNLALYETVEVMPQNRPNLNSLRKFHCGGGIYAKVPVEKLQALVSRHGGVSSEVFLMDAENYGKDFPEDFELENGNYTNTCCSCGMQFIGHKRRVTCKLCFEKAKKVEALNEIG